MGTHGLQLTHRRHRAATAPGFSSLPRAHKSTFNRTHIYIYIYIITHVCIYTHTHTYTHPCGYTGTESPAPGSTDAERSRSPPPPRSFPEPGAPRGGVLAAARRRWNGTERSGPRAPGRSRRRRLPRHLPPGSSVTGDRPAPSRRVGRRVGGRRRR